MWIRKMWKGVYLALLFAFTVYAVLDTFVISSVYAVVDQEQPGVETLAKEPAEPASRSKEQTGRSEQAEQTDKNEKKQRKNSTKGSSTKGLRKVHAAEVPEGTANAEASQAEAAGGAGKGENMAAGKTGTTETAATGKTGTTEAEEPGITMTQYREYDTDIYVAQIKVSQVTSLRTAFARNAYGRNVTATTSETAENVGAVLAINGDYYGAREKGYVIRNGVLYREEGREGQEDLVLYQDGSMAVIREGEVSAAELVSQGAWQVWSFGPALIENGEIAVSTTDEVAKAMQDNPRTAIGILENGDYVMVVSDGRTDASEGLSLYELADFLKGLGAVTAYNLDGGGSSTMVFQGELVNRPTTTGRIKERAVSDIIYIAAQ